jgi:hypothetical protein
MVKSTSGRQHVKYRERERQKGRQFAQSVKPNFVYLTFYPTGKGG